MSPEDSDHMSMDGALGRRNGFASRRKANPPFRTLSSQVQSSAHSKIPLTIWFEAIQTVIANPDVTAERLAEHPRLNRIETARTLKGKILKAMHSPHRSVLLAGLDDHFGGLPVLSAHPAELETALRNALSPTELTLCRVGSCSSEQ